MKPELAEIIPAADKARWTNLDFLRWKIPSELLSSAVAQASMDNKLAFAPELAPGRDQDSAPELSGSLVNCSLQALD
jgi:hypothetical protein